jgi:D-citramalate synthase
MKNAAHEARHVAIMDTTLRDGEQTPDVAYTPAEKLQLAKLLLQEVEVDRIEIASTRVSEGEREAARMICAWARKARCQQRIEVLGYCDGKASVDWLSGVGGKTLNLLTKGSERHCREQLGMTPEQHRKSVEETVRNARRRRMVVNVYLEDWSNGVRESFDYVFAMVELLRELRVARIYLADTLGVFSPEDTARYVGLMTATWPAVDFEFHGHNDYSLATANCLAALRAGARGIHTSVNGMGERAGNTKLAEVVAAVHDHSDMRTGVNEARLSSIAQMVETFSGKEIASNAPIVGRDVFTQTAGIHADGDAKGDLYASKLAPARFGRARRYALGKLSGKASLDHNLKALGIDLDASERAIVLQRIIELGDRKNTITPEDLPYIIADVLKSPEEQLVRVENYHVVVGGDQEPTAAVKLSYGGVVEEAEATGDGGYDAFMNAVGRAARSFKIEVPPLADYRVRIPPGGRSTALVETVISWRRDASTRPGPGSDTFSTIGVDSDQLAAAVIATEKMLNAVVPRPRAAKIGKPGKPAKPSKSNKSNKSNRSNKTNKTEKSARTTKGAEPKGR